MAEQLCDLADLRDPGGQIVHERDPDDPKSEDVQQPLRQRAVPGTDQDEVGLERDHGFRGPAQQRIRQRLVGNDRDRRIVRIGRQRDDLVGVGERDHELVGADIERRHAPGRIGGVRGRAPGKRKSRQRKKRSSSDP